MSSTALIRFSGLAAILAGLLRGIASVLPSTIPIIDLEILYFFTDVFILFGLMGLYAFQHEEIGVGGFIGFLIATVGIGSIIGPDGEISGLSMYVVGASIFAVGLNLFAIGTWKASKLPRWVPALWILSTIIGFIGYFAKGYSMLFVISGIIFSVSYGGAGVQMWSAVDNTRRSQNA
jgi:hypothetical protein